jgi:hypothetical protein
MSQSSGLFDLSEDERKILLLGLAHLSAYLDDKWSGELRQVARKLDGADLFDEFLGLSANELIEQLAEGPVH